HSLLAMRLVGKYNKVEIAISVTDIFTHPTIESLAAYVQSRTDDLFKKSVAIPLRTGGAEPPLFLVHEATGEILYGAKLVPHLPPGFPIYGLEAPGLAEAPMRTIQAMATRLVRMIRAVQPDGPYRLAGWSYGATLAYEIAIQLIGDDAPVEFLGSLDGYYLGPGTGASRELPVDDKDLLLLMYESVEEQSLNPSSLAIENPSFAILVRACQERLLIPLELSKDEVREYLDRYRNN